MRRQENIAIVGLYPLLARRLHCGIIILLVFIAQCTLVHLRGLGIACRLYVRPSVSPSVCNVGDL